MKYSVTVPETELLSLADTKAHIRALPDDTSEDAAIITPLISAAREYCENVTGRSLAAETVKAYPEKFEPVMRLPRPPISSITSVKYTDKTGSTVTMDAGNYLADAEKIAFSSIPQFDPALLNPIEIEYSAGYTLLPSSIRQAMLLLIGHWYENREAVVVGPVASVTVQIALDRLLSQWKAWWF